MVGNTPQFDPIRHRSVQIDTYDSPRSVRDCGFDRGGINAPCIFLYVGEYRCRSDIDDRSDRGDPGNVWNNYFVSGTNAAYCKGKDE